MLILLSRKGGALTKAQAIAICVGSFGGMFLIAGLVSLWSWYNKRRKAKKGEAVKQVDEDDHNGSEFTADKQTPEVTTTDMGSYYGSPYAPVVGAGVNTRYEPYQSRS